MSEKRKAVLADIESRITDTLKQLGMPNARFRISLSRLKDFTASGIDQADFLFSANKQICTGKPCEDSIRRRAFQGDAKSEISSYKKQ